jgi:transposase
MANYGRGRGGHTTKIHALTDVLCRPIAFVLTRGQVGDCTAGTALLEQLPDCDIVHADKGYDSKANPRAVPRSRRLGWANIPAKANRKWKNALSPLLQLSRNAIERMFCRLKDFRRVATRYDRAASNFLAAVCVVVSVSYWL